MSILCWGIFGEVWGKFGKVFCREIWGRFWGHVWEVWGGILRVVYKEFYRRDLEVKKPIRKR